VTRVAIVIVAWNARTDLERCLRSLAASPPTVSHTIIVVDNASDDGAPEMVASRFPGIRLIRSGENLGFARANNVGIRASASDLVLLLNPDTVVPAGSLDALVARLDRVPAATAAGPRIVDGSGRAEVSFGPMPTPLGEFRQKTVSALHGRRIWPVSAWVERRTRREQFVPWVTGACLLVRRDAAEAVGLLDERYFLYWEDVDFCARLRAAGGRILFTPVAEVVHLRGRSTRGARDPASEAYRRGQLTFYATHQPEWLPALRWYLGRRGMLPR
jgi:N-acetylglucosaminyl-diphospho-decaprenol L-rhamnosyltransferase